MTTPTQDRDITATLSAPREEPTAEALEAAAVRLLAGACHTSPDWYCSTGGEFVGESWTVSRGRDWGWTRWGIGYGSFTTALAAAIDLLKAHPELWPAEPDETAPDHWATIRAALAPGATDDARAAALVAVDALQQEDR